MKPRFLLVAVFAGLLACPLVDDLEALDQVIARTVADGFLRSGQAEDSETRLPLSGAIVELPGLGIRMISDEAGRVDFGRLPIGLHRLTAERVGYDRINRGELPVPWDEDFLILLDRDPDYDPTAPGRIIGRVTEEGNRNRGVSDVDIMVLSPAGARTLSDGQGRFNLTDLEPGLVEVQFSHLGYTSRTTTVNVQPGGTVEVNAPMSAQPFELEPIEITVRSRYLDRNGFYRRARFYWGKQYTRADLEKINPTYLSDLFWRVPGVRVQYGLNGTRVRSGRSRTFSSPGGCVLPVYLDDVRMLDWDLDSMNPEILEAVEVYRGIATPIQYQMGLTSCGVVLLWTRR